MLDLLLEFLGLFPEVIVEATFEFAIEVLSALVWRVLAEFFDTWEFKYSLLATMALLLLGGAAGAPSVLVFPHPLVHPSRFHGISLIVSPALAGLGMSLVGVLLRGRNKKPLPLESFGYGFAFAFGMAVIRLLL